MSTGRSAFVDESAYRRRDGQQVYLLAAALIMPQEFAACSQAMVGLLPRGAPKLHWGKEGGRRQAYIAARIASLDVSHLLVVRSAAHYERLERQRRKCLEQLCCELVERAVVSMVMESRGPADDRRDLQVLQSLRAQQRLQAPLRMIHARGPSEPMLWIADAVCGAYHSGGSPWERLRESSTILEIA